ncbi:unnamed protein product [Cunninghamella echinulata]
MTTFQTDIDLLTFETINSGKTLEITETELSHYINTIKTATLNCTEYYNRIDNKNNNRSFLRDEIYDSFTKQLGTIFEKATQFEADRQLKLIDQLQYELTCESNADFGKSFMSYYDDILQKITIELIITNNKPIETSKQMKQTAFHFLNLVYSACKPFEAMTWIIERLYDLDWIDTDEDNRMKTIYTFVILVKSFEKSVINRTHLLKQLEDFFNNFVNSSKSALMFLENIMKESHSNDIYPDIWELQVANMISSILDVIELYYFKITENKNNIQSEQDNLLESARFLLVLIFDKFILNYNMGLSKKYYDQFHPRYNVPKLNMGIINDLYTSTGCSIMNDLVHRCLILATQLGCSFDKLLYLKQAATNNDDKNEDSYQMNYSAELSFDGIISVLALSIYDRFLSSTTSSTCTHSLLSMMIDPIWIGKHCIGIIMNLLGNPENTGRIDKAMLILLFLSDNVNNEKLKIDLDTIEQKFNGVNNETMITLTTAFQNLTSITSTTNDATLRFLGYQLIDQFMKLSTDETRIFILTELLDNCPFPTMRTASIGLLKNQIFYVHLSHLKQQYTTTKPNVFHSPVIVDKFLPIIFNDKNTLFSQQQNEIDQELFWDKFNYHMQALNFYYYLLSWDKQNQTTIWNKEQLEWMQTNYLNPLMDQCQQISKLYENNSGDDINDNIDGPKVFQLNLIQKTFDDIKRLITEK